MSWRLNKPDRNIHVHMHKHTHTPFFSLSAKFKAAQCFNLHWLLKRHPYQVFGWLGDLSQRGWLSVQCYCLLPPHAEPENWGLSGLGTSTLPIQCLLASLFGEKMSQLRSFPPFWRVFEDTSFTQEGVGMAKSSRRPGSKFQFGYISSWQSRRKSESLRKLPWGSFLDTETGPSVSGEVPAVSGPLP